MVIGAGKMSGTVEVSMKGKADGRPVQHSWTIAASALMDDYYRNGKLYGRAGARTVAGRMTFTRPASWGTYRAVVRKVTATGLRWNGKTPPNLFVRAQRK